MSKRRKFTAEFKRGAVEQASQPGVSQPGVSCA
ncbi:transposase, partial [Xanthomonas euvesicatoria]